MKTGRMCARDMVWERQAQRRLCGAGHEPGRVAGDVEACRQGWFKQGLIAHDKEPKRSKCVGSYRNVLKRKYDYIFCFKTIAVEGASLAQ